MISPNERTLVAHHRFELLDAVRGIGALFVAALHTPPSMQAYLPFPVSFLAVDLFFCLSGFVIAFAYEQRLKKGLPLHKFFLARVVRLFPLYLLGLMLGVIAIVGRSHFLPAGERRGTEAISSFCLNLFMLPALLGKTVTTNAYPFNPPSWSLFFEMAINVAYAAALLARKASSVVLALMALVAFSVTLYAVFWHSAGFGEGWKAGSSFFLGLPRVTFSFFVGVLLFRLFRARPSLRVPQRLHTPAGFLVLLCSVVLLGGSFHFMQSNAYQAVTIALIIPLLIFFGAGIHVSTRWRRFYLVLGEISYPLYILHLPLFSPLYLVQKLRIGGWMYQLIAPLSVVLLAFAARWIALHYDAPARRLLTRKLGLVRRVPPAGGIDKTMQGMDAAA